MKEEKYSPRRCIAILLAAAAFGWFALIGFAVRAAAVVNMRFVC